MIRMTKLSRPSKIVLGGWIGMTSFWCHFAKASTRTRTRNAKPGTLHCEAVLVALALYPDNAIRDDESQMLQRYFSRLTPSPRLILCWQALRIGGIRVSKLCCPACSRLFHCLLQKYKKSHGDDKHWPKILTQALLSHTVPYPVQLPEWLPGDVIQCMINFFRPLLAEALQSLVSPSGGGAPVISPGRVHRSQQSLSGISVGSSNAEVTSTSEVPDRFDTLPK